MPYQHGNGFIFGTVYSVVYQYDDNLDSLIIDRLNTVDASLSVFNDTSVITKVNNNNPVSLSNDFIQVFKKAEYVSEVTNGAFDITVAPLVNLWGFGFKGNRQQNVDTHSLDSIRQFVGYEKVRISYNRILKSDSRAILDCSGIAKGYGADAVASLFDEKGINNYMIEIGGEIVSKGLNDKHQPWKIGITKPVDDSLSITGELQTMLAVNNVCMATSGNYRRFYYKNGNKYAHTIDPITGCPVQHSMLSATVIAPSCATADAFATAFMVMGLERAKKLLDEHTELMAYIIYAGKNGKNDVWMSPKMKTLICQ